MKNLKMSFLLLSLLCLFSCSDDEITDVRILAAGQWAGTFSGGDMGTWTMVISEDGTLTGELLSTNVPGIAFQGTGTVTEDGMINASIQVSTSTSTMSGTINATSASGVWENTLGGISGTWSGTKQ